MKLLKRVAVLSLCVLAVSGCTKSSISAQAPVPQVPQEALEALENIEGAVVDGQIDPEKLAALEGEEETVPKLELVEDETYEVTMFDWEQVSDECADLFDDTGFYPESVKMDYTADEAALTVDLTWVLKNGTPEDVAAETRKVTDALSKDGGYIIAPSQEIQSDVPFENLCALIDTARSYSDL